ncbi:MAG TPA: hypothetical protein VJS12_22395 [Steroidobacteraceae bacterium]|nr:hypothetical protein [Steroidobacteraceae bacterium]
MAQLTLRQRLPQSRQRELFMKAVKTLLGAAVLGLAAYAGPSSAALPENQPGQTLHPENSELLPLGEGRPQFGDAVVVRNDTALVALPVFSGAQGFGRIAIFTREGATAWRRAGQLPCPESQCTFADAISLRDNIAVVHSGLDALMVFRRVQGLWRLTQRIESPDPGLLQFGNGASVRYENGFITAAGRPLDSDGVPGRLYVFQISSAGKLLRTFRLQARDGKPGDGFGVTAAIASNTIVTGAPDAAAAYVFHWNGSTWFQRAKLVPSDSPLISAFGLSVAFDQGLILVGAPFAQVGEHNNRGAVYAYERVNDVWTERQRFRPSSAENPNATEFGTQIVMFGNRAVIAATERPAENAQSLAFVYERTPAGLVARSFVRGPGIGNSGLALFQNVMMLGLPHEGSDSDVGHVRVYNLGLPAH